MQFQSMNISLRHIYGVYSPSPELYRQCCANFIKCIWNIRNEVDKTFVRTKQIDCLICNISIRVHGVTCIAFFKEDCRYF